MLGWLDVSGWRRSPGIARVSAPPKKKTLHAGRHVEPKVYRFSPTDSERQTFQRVTHYSDETTHFSVAHRHRGRERERGEEGGGPTFFSPSKIGRLFSRSPPSGVDGVVNLQLEGSSNRDPACGLLLSTHAGTRCNWRRSSSQANPELQHTFCQTQLASSQMLWETPAQCVQWLKYCASTSEGGVR